MIKKHLFIGECVTEVERGTKRKSPSLRIVLSFPNYLATCRKDADLLINGLIQQHLNRWEKLPIRALSLTWDEYEEDFEK